ncbi:hypothetical protein [Flexivirga meconopsidis]|uniref:hypothetical protein n=1 Tax=Flexivirga meconopsidis TaxID=2977121 RepID=UPI0022403C67|nr:hypothetical protein [Flexivirga meconopsidis]
MFADVADRIAEYPRGRLLAVVAVIAAALLLVIVLVLALIGFNWLKADDGVKSDMIVDPQLPTTSNPTQMAARLNQADAKWNVRATSPSQVPDTVAGQISLPLKDDKALISNLADPDSVRRNGALLMVWTGYSPAAEKLITDDPPVFDDGNRDGAKKRYQLGTWVAYYSPAGAVTNRTDEVRDYLTVVAKCPYDTKPCD